MTFEQLPRDQSSIDKIADMVRYATTLVSIGVNPDDPAECRIAFVSNSENTHICLTQQAAMLRNLADKFDEVHGPDGCRP